MVRINDNRIEGELRVNRGFLNGSKDQGGYDVLIKFDGTPIDTLVKHAVNDGVIVLRKRIKNREQARALADGITFIDMVSASPKDPNAQADSLDVDSLSEETRLKLLARLQSRPAKNLETGEDID